MAIEVAEKGVLVSNIPVWPTEMRLKQQQNMVETPSHAAFTNNCQEPLKAIVHMYIHIYIHIVGCNIYIYIRTYIFVHYIYIGKITYAYNLYMYIYIYSFNQYTVNGGQCSSWPRSFLVTKLVLKTMVGVLFVHLSTK